MAIARERIRLYLAEQPDIEIVGECSDGREALRMISQHSPELVLLDVEMPGLDGFQMLSRLPKELQPIVIFLTAHDQHAIRAFAAQALDYLLKPVDRDRFEQALNRARLQLSLRRGGQEFTYVERLAVRDGGQTHLVPVEIIDYIDVARHYLCLHSGPTVHLMRGTLGYLETTLDPKLFVRIHRSIIVKISRIKSITALRNGDAELRLSDGTKLTLSRNYRANVQMRLGITSDS
jgi:two-component system LytT family response regulator